MSITRFAVILTAAIFFGEIAVMYALELVSIQNALLENILDASALVFLVFPVLYIFSLRAIMQSNKMLEEKVRDRTSGIELANGALEASVSDLKRHHRDVLLLSEMGNFFQSCRNLDEAMTVAEVKLARLFSEVSGSLLLLNNSRNMLELAASWGTPLQGAHHYSPDGCWALRRSKPHIIEVAEKALACEHMEPDRAWHACLPLVAQGESLGTLYLSSRNVADGLIAPPDEDKIKFYEAVSENLALAIANLQLHEKLRYQALRDPLTGLYNRRYLQDALEQELEHSTCHGHPLSMLLFDIDHFKQFNDSFGHAAGDTVLNRLGAVLKEWARPNDVLVRFGGEEFTVVLPQTSADEALVRAENLRKIVESQSIEHEGTQLRRVTISVGVAAFPMHGADRDTLIEKADQALYRSKKGGRNRVTVALGVVQNADTAVTSEDYGER